MKINSKDSEKKSIQLRQSEGTTTKEVKCNLGEIQNDQELNLKLQEIANQNHPFAEQLDIPDYRNLKSTEALEILKHLTEEYKNKICSLEAELDIKRNELFKSSQQLDHFSFIVSHNLRAPVARILGLGSLLNYEKKKGVQHKQIVNKLLSATSELDCIINDLKLILETRSDVSQPLEEVTFETEFNLIKSNLLAEIFETNTKIHHKFEIAPKVNSVKVYIQNIFFTLISNAIKYRSPFRPLALTVNSFYYDNQISLQVHDNGQGIDLEQHGADLFLPFKRFHFQTEGKGLGLYLLKTQTEALGGGIKVRSKPGIGSVFTIHFK